MVEATFCTMQLVDPIQLVLAAHCISLEEENHHSFFSCQEAFLVVVNGHSSSLVEVNGHSFSLVEVNGRAMVVADCRALVVAESVHLRCLPKPHPSHHLRTGLGIVGANVFGHLGPTAAHLLSVDNLAFHNSLHCHLASED